jgi:hypothetical protein
MRAGLAILLTLTPTVVLTQPADYRRAVLEYARESLFDPYSVRDAEISKPLRQDRGSVVCMRFNAKNKLGAYVGLQQYAVPFLDEKLDSTMLAAMRQVGAHASDILCKGAEYGPFTELERLRER